MDNSITFPLGFTAAGVACGIKKNGDYDLAIVHCERIATAAGMFTKNIVKGHSLMLARKNVRGGRAQSVVINSGNANACMGKRGDSDALRMAAAVSERLGCNPAHVLPGSTGVIGMPLPIERIEKAIAGVCLTKKGGAAAAKAIMTTDTYAKQSANCFSIAEREIKIAGMAKGSGMIHPNMATLIAVITTDAVITRCALKSALKEAVNRSFNRISIDGDMSVCDQVLILASNLAGNETIKKGSKNYKLFADSLSSVCTELAKMLAADGEGATKLLTINVNNARTKTDALKIARAIANSPLCKTAAYGNDANWGRLLSAAGYSGAKFDPSLADIYIGKVQVCKSGVGVKFDENAALGEMDKKEVLYTVDLHSGIHSQTMWTCDFSTDYVRINADYRT